MGQTLALVDAILKEFYDGSIRKQLNNEIKMFKHLEESDKMWAGRRVVFPVHLVRNSGIGARAESAVLPTAGYQGTVECRVSACYHYGRLDLTGQTLKATKNAFADGLALEMEGLKDDIVFDAGRISYGSGQGELAIIAANSVCSSAITVSNKYAAPGHNGARYIQEGEVLNFGVMATPAGATAAVVSVSIADNSGTTVDTITISATALTLSASQFIFRQGAGGQGVEPIGLRGLVDKWSATGLYGNVYYSASKLQNIDRSVYSKWNANVLHNCSTARVLDSKLIQKAFSIQKRESGKDVNMIMAEYFVIDQFLEHVVADRRYATDLNAGDSGETLSYNGVKLVRDLLAPYNEMFLFNKEALKKYTLCDYKFADEDGRIMRQVANYDQWEGFMKAYYNFGVEQPKATTVIRDIIDE